MSKKSPGRPIRRASSTPLRTADEQRVADDPCRRRGFTRRDHRRQPHRRCPIRARRQDDDLRRANRHAPDAVVPGIVGRRRGGCSGKSERRSDGRIPTHAIEEFWVENPNDKARDPQLHREAARISSRKEISAAAADSRRAAGRVGAVLELSMEPAGVCGRRAMSS